MKSNQTNHSILLLTILAVLGTPSSSFLHSTQSTSGLGRWTNIPSTSSGVSVTTITVIKPQPLVLLHSSLDPSEETSSSSFDSNGNDTEEETLLRLRLSIQPGVSQDMALERVQRYAQSFPFSVVLPVQPLQYLPTPSGGVDVLFLLKKTREKGSMDGGVRFHIFLTPPQQGDNDDNDNSSNNDIEIHAKRNSEGQVVSKIFSEKLIVQAFVKGIGGESDATTGVAPTDVISVKSVFHKWL